MSAEVRPAPMRSALVCIASARVTEDGPETLLADLDARVSAGCGFAVATLNLDHLVKLRREPAFREAYARHTHVTADGRPVVWLSRLAGRPVGLATGSDLVVPLLCLAARHGASVAFVGATDDTLARAEAALRVEAPGLSVVLRHAPAHGFDPDGAEADAAIERIRESGARLVLLALGAVRQERLAARLLDRLPGVGVVSVGAGLDFFAGTQVRAPLWMRRLAVEWLWRLANDPGRLARRYLDCALILPGLAVSALYRRSENV